MYYFSFADFCHEFLTHCVTEGGGDVRQCCASNGVTGNCLAVCSGNITNFPTDILSCRSHINTYALCYNVIQTTTVAPTSPGECCLKRLFHMRMMCCATRCDARRVVACLVSRR